MVIRWRRRKMREEREKKKGEREEKGMERWRRQWVVPTVPSTVSSSGIVSTGVGAVGMERKMGMRERRRERERERKKRERGVSGAWSMGTSGA